MCAKKIKQNGLKSSNIYYTDRLNDCFITSNIVNVTKEARKILYLMFVRVYKLGQR